MPAGKVHRSLWAKYRPLSTAAGLIAVIMLPAKWAGVGIIVGYHIGYWITPDLDLISITTEEADWIRSVVFIPLVAWSTFYARIMRVFGGHRSFVSHFPIISTLIRGCWFAFPFLIPYIYLAGPIKLPAGFILGAFSGMCFSDIIHYTADMTYKKPHRRFPASVRARRFSTIRRYRSKRNS